MVRTTQNYGTRWIYRCDRGQEKIRTEIDDQKRVPFGIIRSGKGKLPSGQKYVRNVLFPVSEEYIPTG